MINDMSNFYTYFNETDRDYNLLLFSNAFKDKYITI